jgi:hypothetical protein
MGGNQATNWLGALAQLGEHLLCKQGVIGSIPIGSTIRPCGVPRWGAPSNISPEMKTTVFVGQTLRV